MRPIIGLGMAAIAAGLGLMAASAGASTYWPVLASTVLVGAGIALAATPATDCPLPRRADPSP
jgi:hypothetical protein